MTEETNKRTQRVAELLQRTVAQLLATDFRDPRMPRWVTVSAVKVSKDLKVAKVYFTLLEGDPMSVASVLNAATGYFRKTIGKKLALRAVPQLHFVHDDSVDYGRRLSALINESNHEQPEPVDVT